MKSIRNSLYFQTYLALKDELMLDKNSSKGIAKISYGCLGRIINAPGALYELIEECKEKNITGETAYNYIENNLIPRSLLLTMKFNNH